MTTEEGIIGLQRILRALLQLMRCVGERHWAETVERALLNLEMGATKRWIEEILSWYGGMGSLNDLVIAKVNGHNVEPQDEQALNAELARLTSALYARAVHLLAVWREKDR